MWRWKFGIGLWERIEQKTCLSWFLTPSMMKREWRRTLGLLVCFSFNSLRKLEPMGPAPFGLIECMSGARSGSLAGSGSEDGDGSSALFTDAWNHILSAPHTGAILPLHPTLNQLYHHIDKSRTRNEETENSFPNSKHEAGNVFRSNVSRYLFSTDGGNTNNNVQIFRLVLCLDPHCQRLLWVWLLLEVVCWPVWVYHWLCGYQTTRHQPGCRTCCHSPGTRSHCLMTL